MTRLISSYELGEDIDKLMDAWGPNWISDPHKKLALDDLWEAQRHIESFEAAARKRAGVTEGEGSLLPLMADLYGNNPIRGTSSGSLTDSDSHRAVVDDSPDDRARKAGAGA